MRVQRFVRASIALCLAVPQCVAAFQRCALGPCGLGEYFVKNGHDYICLKCPNGEFMDQSAHQCTQCVKCAVLTPEIQYNLHQLVAALCTTTRDTQFECGAGYCRIPSQDLSYGFECIEVSNPADYPTTRTTTLEVPTPMPTTPVPTSPQNWNVSGYGNGSIEQGNITEGNTTHANKKHNSTNVVVVVMAVFFSVGVFCVVLVFVVLNIYKRKCRGRKDDERSDAINSVSQNGTTNPLIVSGNNCNDGGDQTGHRQNAQETTM